MQTHRRMRQLSPTQIEANRKRFEEAEFTVRGKYGRDEFVTDGLKVYRIVTIGFETKDPGLREYGVAVARAPKAWMATKFLRATIKAVLETGTHEPESAGARALPRPGRIPNQLAPQIIWTDTADLTAGTDSRLTVHGDCVRVVSASGPHGSKVIAWVQDTHLVMRIKTAVTTAPTPFEVTKVVIHRRDRS